MLAPKPGRTAVCMVSDRDMRAWLPRREAPPGCLPPGLVIRRGPRAAGRVSFTSQ